MKRKRALFLTAITAFAVVILTVGVRFTLAYSTSKAEAGEATIEIGAINPDSIGVNIELSMFNAFASRAVASSTPLPGETYQTRMSISNDSAIDLIYVLSLTIDELAAEILEDGGFLLDGKAPQDITTDEETGAVTYEFTGEFSKGSTNLLELSMTVKGADLPRDGNDYQGADISVKPAIVVYQMGYELEGEGL